MTVDVKLELGEEFLSDVLVTAFDGDYGGCWYWAHSKGENAYVVEGETWRSVAIAETEPREGDGHNPTYVVDHALLAKGIELLFAPGVMPNRGDVRNAVLQQDGGEIDCEAADIIVQLAVFGDVIYG